MNREDKRGIFFGVVGVLTLIVAIIGASLAYFSINVRSETDRLTVQAASVQIVYEDGNKLDVKNIIPSTKEVAVKAYTRYLNNESYSTNVDGVPVTKNYEECIDDNNNVVCGVYEFTLTNNGTNPAEITARVVPTVVEGEDGEPTGTQFQHLMYSLYDVTEVPVDEETGRRTGTGTAVQVNEGGATEGTVTYTEFKILPTATKLDGNGTQKVYRLFVWLNEEGEANNAEQGASFKGTVYIDVAGSQTITGTITESE